MEARCQRTRFVLVRNSVSATLKTQNKQLTLDFGTFPLMVTYLLAFWLAIFMRWDDDMVTNIGFYV